MKRITKKFLILLSPLSIFVLLYYPYSLFNSQYVINWFGCGCPTVDEYGNMVEKSFNANDFTMIFWLCIAVIATIISCFTARSIPKDRWYLRVIYVVLLLALSLFFAYAARSSMMWK